MREHSMKYNSKHGQIPPDYTNVQYQHPQYCRRLSRPYKPTFRAHGIDNDNSSHLSTEDDDDYEIIYSDPDHDHADQDKTDEGVTPQWTMVQNDAADHPALPNEILPMPDDEFHTIQAWLLHTLEQGKTMDPQGTFLMNIDGGANIHIFTDRQLFCIYKSLPSSVKQVIGSKSKWEGLGILMIILIGTDITIPIYPVYNMTQNPQHTLGTPDLKQYNQFRQVKITTL